MSSYTSADLAAFLDAYNTSHVAPEHVAGVVSGEDDRVEAALEYMESAVLHQQLPWPITGPFAAVISDVLASPESEGVRVELLRFLGMVAESATQFDADRAQLDIMIAEAGEDLTDALTSIVTEPDDDLLEQILDDETLSNALVAYSVVRCADVAPDILSMAAGFVDAADPAVAQTAAATVERLREVCSQYE